MSEAGEYYNYYYRRQLLIILMILMLSATLVSCNNTDSSAIPTLASTAQPAFASTQSTINLPATNTPVAQITSILPTSTPVPPTATITNTPEATPDITLFGDQGALEFMINGSNYLYPLNSVELNGTGQPMAPDGAEFAIINTSFINTDGTNTALRLFTTHNYEATGTQLINQGLQLGTEVNWISQNQNGQFTEVTSIAGWSGTMPVTEDTYTSNGLLDYVSTQGVDLENIYGFVLTCGTNTRVRNDLGGGSYPDYYHVYSLYWPGDRN